MSNPGPTGPPAWDFKGHPQPPVDARLETAENFLADEDPDRCLEFDKKIDEIEELLAQIEKDKLPHDAERLNNVKVMVQEHRDWQKGVDDGWRDTTCTDLPPRNPYSTRLLNEATSTIIEDEKLALGLIGQMREDAPPFTVERETDHNAFLDAMKNDSVIDPNTIDKATNLLYTESRAYNWAIKDPAFIPLWMHPTKGIQKKGTTAADDKPWYKVPELPPHRLRIRPERGTLPDYLLVREERINALLSSARRGSTRDMVELEDLLSYHFPNELKRLHEQYTSFLASAQVTLDPATQPNRPLTPLEIRQQTAVKTAYENAFIAWVTTFNDDGVYLIPRKPQHQTETELPGVFYVDDGVLDDDRTETLLAAQNRLNVIRANDNWQILAPAEGRLMEKLVRDAQPQNVQDAEKARDDVLRSNGVEELNQLPLAERTRWNTLDATAAGLRQAWYAAAVTAGLQLEFRYLRPGEIKEADPSIIYLPWSMTAMPNTDEPRLGLPMSAEVDRTRLLISTKLANNSGVNLTLGSNGDVEGQDLLMQLAYPRLRRLLLPWITIRNKRAADPQSLTQLDNDTWTALNDVVTTLWDDWVRSLKPEVWNIKMIPAHRPESPDVLYWRPTTITGNPDVTMRRLERNINRWLNSPVPPGPFRAWANQIRPSFNDLLYPGLRLAYDKITNLDAQTQALAQPQRDQKIASLTDEANRLFATWVSGLLGHRISIKRPQPFLDPDDDPGILYYRGALDEARATKRVRDRMDLTKTAVESLKGLGAFSAVAGVGDLIPPYIKHLQSCVKANPTDPVEQAVLTWHLEYIRSGPLIYEEGDGAVNALDVWQSLASNEANNASNSSNQSSRLSSIDGSNGSNRSNRSNLSSSSGWSSSSVTGSSEPEDGNLSTTNTRNRTQPSCNRLPTPPGSYTSNSSWSSSGSITSDYRRRARRSNFYPVCEVPNTANGFFVHLPTAQRTSGPHPTLQVDFDRFRRQIAFAERELNDLLGKLRPQYELPVVPATPPVKAPTPEVTADRDRLNGLLRQFLPPYIVRLGRRNSWFLDYVNSIPDNGTALQRSRKQSAQEVLSRWQRETTMEVNKWQQELIISSRGVYISISTNREDNNLGDVLEFNPTLTGTGNDFRVTAPRNLDPTNNPLYSSALTPHDPDPVPTPNVFAVEQPFRQAFLPRLRNRINELLQMRATNTQLNREDAEELLDKMIGLMPQNLSKLEAELWAVEARVRRPLVAGVAPSATDVEDADQWYLLNNRFITAYDHWLDSFPQAGIFIQPDKSAAINQAAATQAPVFIEDPDFWRYWTPAAHGSTTPVETLSLRRGARSRQMPQHVSRLLATLNSYFAGTRPVPVGEDVNLLLAPLYRHYGQRIRDRIHTALGVQPNVPLLPEQDVVIETTEAIAFSLWLLDMKVAARNPGRRVRIVEYSPGRFHMYFGLALPSLNGLASPYPRGFEQETRRFATILFDRVWQQPQFQNERVAFLEVAARVRTHARLRSNELNNLKAILTTVLSSTSSLAYQSLVTSYINGSGNARQIGTAVLATNFMQLLYWNWAHMYEHITKPATQLAFPTIDALTNRPLCGHHPPRAVPIIASPTESEIRSVEIEINNLLTKMRNNQLSARQQLELDYLLEALLPPALKTLKVRLDRLWEDYVQLPGLSPNDTYQCHLYYKEWAAKFTEYKQRIPRSGIFLDKWWYVDTAIEEVCSRARQWQEAELKDVVPGEYPTTSVTLEEDAVRNWHDLYLDMRDYANTFDEDPAREERLLFHALPADFSAAKAELALFKQKARDAPPATTTVALLDTSQVVDVMRKFLQAWTEWMVNLPAIQLATLRQRVRDNTSDIPIPPGTDNTVGPRGPRNRGGVNFSSKAERRGIQRAAVELALNILASNQEQHRPLDIYRILDLPKEYTAPDEGVPLCLPLDPWNRPVELDTFEYTKKLTAFHQAKDEEYSLARTREHNEHPSELPVPANHNGPFAGADDGDVEDAKREWLRELATVSLHLQHANLDAPRPLLQEILNCLLNGTAQDSAHPLNRGPPLTRNDVLLLAEIAEPSWDELRQEFPTLVSNTPNYQELLKRQEEAKEFEAELDTMDWQNRTWLPAPMALANADPLAQPIYDPLLATTQGYTITVITQHINTARISKAITDGLSVAPSLYSEETAVTHLTQLQVLRRIHMNQAVNNRRFEPFETLVAKIPVNGHPENKYITSRAAVRTSAGVVFDAVKSEYIVQYDASGKKGPPIVQPNKYEHLRFIAYRIGRDTQAALETRAAPTMTEHQLLNYQWSAIFNTQQRMFLERPRQNAVRVEEMALELNKIDPLLAVENNIPLIRSPPNPPRIAETPAAMLLQMQMIEELSNCWEPRFPQKERLWEFSNERWAPQLRTIQGRKVMAKRRLTRFFDVRRWPPGCQDTVTRTAIKNSGPEVQEKPNPQGLPKAPKVPKGSKGPKDPEGENAPVPVLKPPTVQEQQVAATKKQARHLMGQPPHFPFGETPYQQAYQSFLMEWDLRDVPEFQVPPTPRPGLFGRNPSPEPKDPFALPNVPSDWQPDSISIAEKRAQLIEAAKQTAGFPDANVLEFYHTPEEIEAMKKRDAIHLRNAKIKIAQDAITERVGKQRFEQVTPAEYNTACLDLGIDRQTGMFMTTLPLPPRARTPPPPLRDVTPQRTPTPPAAPSRSPSSSTSPPPTPKTRWPNLGSLFGATPPLPPAPPVRPPSPRGGAVGEAARRAAEKVADDAAKVIRDAKDKQDAIEAKKQEDRDRKRRGLPPTRTSPRKKNKP